MTHCYEKGKPAYLNNLISSISLQRTLVSVSSDASKMMMACRELTWSPWQNQLKKPPCCMYLNCVWSRIQSITFCTIQIHVILSLVRGIHSLVTPQNKPSRISWWSVFWLLWVESSWFSLFTYRTPSHQSCEIWNWKIRSCEIKNWETKAASLSSHDGFHLEFHPRMHNWYSFCLVVTFFCPVGKFLSLQKCI